MLIEARNLLMLMKPSDFSGEANPNGTLPMKPTPRTMERFRAQNIPGSSELILPLSKVDSTQTPPLQIPFPLPWNYRIASPAAAHWVCNTAADVVDSILKVVPDGPHKPYLLEHCKTFKRLN